jgi:tryptophan 7-halogenase
MDQSQENRLRRVVVVGGGSAGWITAARIAARNGTANLDGIEVILIESSAIGTIGVGEGTWPTMRNTLRKIGIRETDFIRSCNAAFKQGARFNRWTDGTANEGYYHPLNPPQSAASINLSPHWQRDQAGADFADAVDFQAALCDAGLAPKSITTPEYGGLANYAYHLDAGKFAGLLRDHSVEKLGVRHIVDDVQSVNQHENGDISSVICKINGEINGDLFVDCTGFAALLIGEVYGVPFVECSDVLFADHALAMQVPYANPDDPIATHTISTAQSAGWVWDIGLPTRRGIGHVYSSSYVSHDQAEAELRAYIGPQAEGLSARRIKIKSGHRKTFWVKNCVAIGLSNGFLEPLEASALMLIELAVDFVADHLPQNRSAMDILSRQFNTAFEHHWARIIEFLKLHYVLTKRDDTAFWRDNRDPASIPLDLKERLELWRHHPPGPHDFTHHAEVFSWPSYQYVLHGMGFEADYTQAPKLKAEQDQAARAFLSAQRAKQQALSTLPNHRQLLETIAEHGLQLV